MTLQKRIKEIAAEFLATADLVALCKNLTEINTGNIFLLTETDLEPIRELTTKITDKNNPMLNDIYTIIINNIWMAKSIGNMPVNLRDTKRPIVILEAHTDLAAINLVSELAVELKARGYDSLLIEQPLQNSADASGNMQFAADNEMTRNYKKLCRMSLGTFMAQVNANAADLANNLTVTFPEDYSKFQMQIAEDIVTREWIEEFLPKMHKFGYKITPVDTRSTINLDNDSDLCTATLTLRDIGFALSLALYPNSLMIVGAAHGPGIQKLYNNIFSINSQPLFIRAASISVGQDSLLMHVEQQGIIDFFVKQASIQPMQNYLVADTGTNTAMQHSLDMVRSFIYENKIAVEQKDIVPMDVTNGVKFSVMITSGMDVGTYDSLFYLLGDLSSADINTTPTISVLTQQTTTMNNSGKLIPEIYHHLSSHKLMCDIIPDLIKSHNTNYIPSSNVKLNVRVLGNTYKIFIPLEDLNSNILVSDYKDQIREDLGFRYKIAYLQDDRDTLRNINFMFNQRLSTSANLITSSVEITEEEENTTESKPRLLV